MLEAPLAGLPDPCFAFSGEAGSQIINRSLAAAMVVFPEQSAEETSGVQVGLDVKQVKENHENPQGEISQPILEDVGSLFLLSCGWVGHSP